MSQYSNSAKYRGATNLFRVALSLELRENINGGRRGSFDPTVDSFV